MEEIILVMPSTNEEKKTEIVWVDKDFAETIKKLGSLESSKVQIKKQYASIRETSQIEIDNCEDDVKRLKESIDKRNRLLEEAAQYDYDTWEEMDRKFRGYRTEIQQRMTDTMKYAREINDQLKQIDIWKIDKLIETVEKFSRMSESDKDVLKKLLEIG